MTEIVRWLRHPRPVLRAALEVLNAANGVRPLGREGYVTLPVFAFGWPTTEVAPLYLGVSVLDAARRGLRGDFSGSRGRLALGLTGVAWALLGVIMYRDARSDPHWIALCARHWATTTRRWPRPVSAVAGVRGDRHVADPAPIRQARQHRSVRAARPGQLRRHLAAGRPARRRPPRAGRPAGARWRLVDRHAPAAGLPADELPRRARLGLRLDGLPRQPGAHLAGSHRRRQACVGVDQGAHRRVRR